MLIRFRGRIFGRDGHQWYVWEPRWDSMRPIDGYAWDGTRYILQDTRYLGDLFEENFGFGEHVQKCAELTGKWADQLDSVPESKDAVIGNAPVWWKDAWVALANMEVSPTTWARRHRYLQTRPRTCRKPPRGKRSTKRHLK